MCAAYQVPDTCRRRCSIGLMKGDHPTTNVVGNTYDKYGTTNPIARWLMHGFLDGLGDLYRRAAPRTVLEVGCGEGLLADHLIRLGQRPERFEACDLSLDHLAPGLDPLITFRTASIYELPYPDQSFDLVLCCEVLEHLEHPSRGMDELARVASQTVIVSTPWEPVWRLMNIARGRYLRQAGNTPGHIQNFSRRALRNLAGQALVIDHERRPLPWTILSGRPRDQPS